MHSVCVACEGRAAVPQKPSKKAKAEAKRTGVPAPPRIEPCKECKGTGLVKLITELIARDGLASDGAHDRSKKQKRDDDASSCGRDGGGGPAAAVGQERDDPVPASTTRSRSAPWRPPCCGGCAAAAPVAVIGAGIGGCGVALALQQRGIPVVVYERDDSFEQRRQG